MFLVPGLTILLTELDALAGYGVPKFTSQKVKRWQSRNGGAESCSRGQCTPV